MTPLTNSKFDGLSQPKLLRGAVTVTPLQTSLCLRISFFFFCLHARSDMRVYPHSASKWKCHTHPVVASRLPRASRRLCTALYMNATGRSRAANHMLTEGACTASYVKLNFAVWQPSLAQQKRAFSHFSPSTTTLLA